MSAWWGGNLMAVVDEELREQLFADAPAEADLWMGDVNDVGGEREIVPFRFGGLDFWVIFASPHAEADHDDDLLKLFMDTLDVRDFEPDEQSRLIKFCRCDARQNHFIAKDWKLSETSQIFQFLDVLRTILDMYFRASPNIQQFFYLAEGRLQKAYARMLKKLLADLNGALTAILPEPGGCYAFRRA